MCAFAFVNVCAHAFDCGPAPAPAPAPDCDPAPALSPAPAPAPAPAPSSDLTKINKENASTKGISNESLPERGNTFLYMQTGQDTL